MSDNTNVHRVVGNLLVGTSHFFVDTVNNQVGINTSSPSASLDIASGDLKVGSGITLASGGTITATNFSGNGSGLTQVNSDSGSWVNGTNSNVHLAVSTDKVGIGTVDPACALDVAGEDVMIRGNTPSLHFSEGTNGMDGTFRIHYDGANQVDDDNFLAIQHGTNFADTSLHCTLGGRVGIGTSSPGHVLDIQGSQAYDGSTTLRVLNPASAYGRTQLHLVGRYEANNDGWSAGGARNAIMFKSQSSQNSAITNQWTIQSFPNGTSNDLGFMSGSNNAPRFIIRGNGSTEFFPDAQHPLKVTNQGTATNTYNFVLNGPRPGTSGGGATHFINGSTRGDDGGTNTYTIRNDSGPLRLGHGSYNTVIDGSSVGVGVLDPDSKLEVRGHIQASHSDTNHGMLLESVGTLRRNYGGYGAGFHFTNIAIWPTDYLGNYSAGGIDFGNSSYRWKVIWTGGLNASSTINLTTSASIRQDSTTWTGNPGVQGKLEYHDRKWYVVAGSNSNELAIFRRDGTDKVSITNDGNFLRRGHSKGYLVGSYNSVGANSYKTNPIYTIGTSYMPSDDSLGIMYGIGYSHGNFTAALRSNEGYGWGLYVAADGNARIGLNGGTGSIKMICEENGDSYAWEPANDGWLRLQGNASGQGNMSGDYTSLAVGNFYAAGALRFSSDDRVKHFEEEIPNALELIQQLKPYKYKKTSKIYDEDYTGDIGEDWKWEIGLIAQDVEKIPYLEHTVSKPEDGAEGKYGLNYTQFIGVCIQGIKDLSKKLDEQNQKLESRVTLLETALTSVYNDINRDWVRYEKVDPKPKNVSIPAEVSNYLVKLGWACALIKEGREVTFQSGRTAKVKEVLDQKNFTVDRSLVDGQDTLERVGVETIKKDDLLNVAVSTVREVSETILDEGVLKKVDDRLAVLDARLAALENM